MHMIMAFLLPVQSLRIPKRSGIASTYIPSQHQLAYQEAVKTVKEGFKNSGNGGFFECYAKTNHDQVPFSQLATT